MYIRLLGPMAVSRNGRERSVQPNQVRTTLAVLALSSGDVVATEQLIDELWEGRPPGNPRNALQANVARLRRFLERVESGVGGRAIHTSSHGYLLDLPQSSIDVGVFESRVNLGIKVLLTSPTAAIDILEQALKMWRGPALLDVGGGVRCRADASRLNERRLDAHKKLIEGRMSRAHDQGVVSELKQLAAEHPSDERLSALLMLALYRGGRQSEALAVFHSTRAWLSAELGLEPGPGLRRVQQGILAQDRDLEVAHLLQSSV
jgi:DNA-binding SARP family transcriptional activator